ncbi:uncharacterized protein LOC126898498 isoform X2 [Daktulosphaira vitifoliae]|uniref:uncharacterized protein LOC126898498 isoform X2 n=1 Tax=Daktulosphaira vitifoliae TaxID=58002 RepID=UPI0021AAEA44|nr:uncharacterized protein LOC126898498 isoform X2 [Daktulosphaira vitifoliae]
MQIYEERNISKNNVITYTEEFMKIIILFIVPTAKLMKDAMDALGSIHYKPWANIKKKKNNNHYIMSPLLERIGDILDKLNERTLSRDDIYTYIWAFHTIYSFSNSIIEDIQYDTDSYCEFVSYNQNYLWHEWILEYNTIIKQDEKLVFLNFLTRKFKDYIKTVIIENYFQLGFKFDSFTEETFLPKSGEQYIQELEFKVTDEYSQRYYK